MVAIQTRLSPVSTLNQFINLSYNATFRLLYYVEVNQLQVSDVISERILCLRIYNQRFKYSIIIYPRV